jgi:hypothetical protein
MVSLVEESMTPPKESGNALPESEKKDVAQVTDCAEALT